MILHTASFTWIEKVTDDDVSRLTEALTEMAAGIPSLRSYVVGRNLKLRPSDVDFVVTAIVDDAEALSAYLDHPAHTAVYASHLGWMIAERHAAQLEVSAGTLSSPR